MNYRQTRNYENLERRIFPGVGEFDIPPIQRTTDFAPCEMIRFGDAKRCSRPEQKGVHFFTDDYKFNRLWTNIDRYVPMLSKFSCVLSPDFSIYTDFPRAIQLYNHYRKHWVGAYLQEQGITVIPTVTWGGKDTWDFCFDGEPVEAVIAVSALGARREKQERIDFIDGYNEMVDRLKPQTILFYGTVPKECYGNIIRIKTFWEQWKEAKCDGAW